MAGYKPLYIKGMETGLVQQRENFLLPDDAYPILENAFVWRERIKRKQGYQLLGRLRRVLTTVSIGNISAAGAGTFTFNIFTGLGVLATQPNAQLQAGTVANPLIIAIGAPISQTLTDTLGIGTFTVTGAGPIISATINYSTGILSITFSGAAGASAATITGAYYPNLPVMGLRTRQLTSVTNEQMIAFDQVYAYRFDSPANEFVEFIPGTTWTGSDSDFFWSTNYWVGDGNLKIFWVTNFNGPNGDPIRYTNGASWIDFAPIINSAGDQLIQALAILPFRGQLLALNTIETVNGTASQVQFFQRVRWSAIGNPFTVPSAIVTDVNPDAWLDDKRGQGGFLDIPTAEDITAVGYVRDNLVIYCERSTWQLRYTGRSIAPFIIERVNSELGAQSTFSAVQFDTSLVGIGQVGVVECDSFKSNKIDIKIPDLTFGFDNDTNGPKRVHGIRDFVQRIAYWTYADKTGDDTYTNPTIFPNRRLVYNYENDSWAIFTDSLTTLGTFQPQTTLRWQQVNKPWSMQNYPWFSKPAIILDIVGGNQQGFVEYLDIFASNDVSLTINNIIGHTTTSTEINSVNHNLQTGDVIEIVGIPTGTPFATSLNNHIFAVVVFNSDVFFLNVYNSTTKQFSSPQLDAPGTYIGVGLIEVRDNFSITSKKFNALESGQNIQMGYLDILMSATTSGAISLNVYIDYNDSMVTNTLNQNVIAGSNPPAPDTFFNTIIPTSGSSFDVINSDKYWHRVFCPIRGNFITLEYTLSPAQMNGIEQESEVQIDAQILWLREAGRIGF